MFCFSRNLWSNFISQMLPYLFAYAAFVAEAKCFQKIQKYYFVFLGTKFASVTKCSIYTEMGKQLQCLETIFLQDFFLVYMVLKNTIHGQ